MSGLRSVFGFVAGLVRRASRGLRRRRRLPVVLQMSVLECGAACLSMILAWHGRRVGLTECRDRVGASRDGTTALAIANAARMLGLRTRAYSIESPLLSQVPLPCVAHWNFNHFVVVERWDTRWVEIVDPASGRRRLKRHEFDAAFTGVVLAFEPGAGFTSGENAAERWWGHLRLMARVPGLRGALAQVLVISLLLQAAGLAVPLATKLLVDHVVPLRMEDLLPALGTGLLLLVCAYAVLAYLRAALLVWLQGRLDAKMMLGFFEHLLSLPYRFFQGRSSGDLLLRLGSNAVIRDSLTNQSVSVVLDGSMVIVYLGVLLALAPGFGVVVLAVGAAQVAVALVAAPYNARLMQRELAAHADSQGYLVEALKGMATLKAAGAESRVLDNWSNLFYRHLNVSLERSHLGAVVSTLQNASRLLSPLLLLWVGTLLVFRGEMTLGSMLALNALALSFLAPLSSLVSQAMQLQMIGAHVERILDVVRTHPEQDRRAVRPAHRLHGALELDDVHFGYAQDAPAVLRGICLKVDPGQKVAIVGPTGSGKTTLGLLALGLYQPTRGRILYDGVDLRELDYASVREQLGVVLQDAALFSGSIRQNITLNAPNVPLEQVLEAARIACIHDEISAMPMGYETLLSEGGRGLSGGQIQRLTIARALVHGPAILVLDEATSHLDAETERQLEGNFSQLRCTRLVIAHRLSTVRDADLVVVLKDGELLDAGTHDELLELSEVYATLVRGQVLAA